MYCTIRTHPFLHTKFPSPSKLRFLDLRDVNRRDLKDVDRRDVFMNKRYLKGKGKSITESLTAFRMQKLKNARDEHGFFNVWTVDGKIMFKNSENGKPNVYYD